jgi:surface antigen
MPLAAPPEAREVAAAPGAETGTAVAAAAVDPAATDMSGSSPAEAQGVIAEAASDGAARTNTDTLATPLPPVVVDQADPYQKRAVAVGLHPDLSRAVLAKLSKDDYRNAATAIKRAFAEPPGAAAFVWPREVKGKLAQFEVRFVASASPECRRYVVSVIKDRWSTTAPAMEKCGADVPKGKTARAAAG